MTVLDWLLDGNAFFTGEVEPCINGQSRRNTLRALRVLRWYDQ